MQKPHKNKLIFSKIKRRLLKHLWLVRLALLVSIAAIITLPIVLLISFLKNSTLQTYINLGGDFIIAPKYKLFSQDNRVNVLILGKGGLGHEAPDLTDTMAVVSVSETSSKATIISLPRDIWSDTLQAKINTAYHYGGLVLAKTTVEDILGIQINYALVIDFAGFTKVIDGIGGIDVQVQEAFTDTQYPIAGKEDDLCAGDRTYKCRYETIHFDKGTNHMDGATALKFVRSRHSQDDQGNDLAREARQQLVISAIKTKILSKDILLSPQKITNLISLSKSYVQTDLQPDSLAVLAHFAFSARNSVTSYVLPEDLLLHPSQVPKYQNQYVFIPKSGNWTKIHDWIKTILP